MLLAFLLVSAYAAPDVFRRSRISPALLKTPHWPRGLPSESIVHSSSFRIWPFAQSELHVRGVTSGASDLSEYFSIATQASIDFIHEIHRMAERSDCRISAAVLILNDIGKSHQLVQRLRECSPDIAHKVDFHFVFVTEPPGLYTDHGLNKRSYSDLVADASGSFAQFSCEDVISKGFQLVFASAGKFAGRTIPYPVNMLRNVALRYITTPHVMTLDGDLVPGPQLSIEYMRAMKDLESKGHTMGSVVLVAPVFEMNGTLDFPRSKGDLQRLVKQRKMRQFYLQLCSSCHYHTNYSRWLQDPATNELLYHVGPKGVWEPYFAGLNASLPAYDSRFQQYGYDRASHLLETSMKGLDFFVMRRAFLVHPGFKVPQSIHAMKDSEEQANKVLFNSFRSELLERQRKKKVK